MIVYIIIGITVLFSIRGFNDFAFRESWIFDPKAILQNRDWKRMITPGFLHADWMHLLFNMYAFLSFGEVIAGYFGEWGFAGLYFGSLITGNLLSLYIHRNDSHYRALGASGAVSGVVYASIVLNPYGGIGLIFIPGVWIPSWIFGLLFIAYSIFGMRSNRDNIGHDAHLGGAIGGLIITVAAFWNVYPLELWVIALLLIPTVIFLWLIVKRPDLVLPKPKGGRNFTVEMPTKFEGEVPPLNENRKRELDRLLDKVNKIGYDNLSRAEKQRLEDLRRHL
ncbi:MAG: rhomboid family intramembrane serine protease [Bacteroidetes bacterium]|nr:rhomboid family intramembrane serine protease [Bacteroidota bacterium]